MNIFSKFLISTGIALTFTTPAFAQSLDLVGVTLGMTHDEAEAALIVKNYVPTAPRVSNHYIKNGPTFSQHVEKAEGKYILGTDEAGISKTHYARGDNFREWVEVYFTEMPAGAFVTSVRYTFTDSTVSTVSKPEFTEKVTGKYGPPSQTFSSTVYWNPEKTFKVDSAETNETLKYGLFSSVMKLELDGKFKGKSYLKMIQDARPKGKIDTTF